ncbi:MAG: hypothetical protein AB7S65_06960 [Sulfuricurvum sp.]
MKVKDIFYSIPDYKIDRSDNMNQNTYIGRIEDWIMNGGDLR